MGEKAEGFLMRKMENITSRVYNVFLNLPQKGGDEPPKDACGFFWDRGLKIDEYLEERCDFDAELSGGGNYWLFAERALPDFKLHFIEIASELSGNGCQMNEAELFAHVALWNIAKAKEILESVGPIADADIHNFGTEDAFRHAFASSLCVNAMEALCIAESACVPRFDVKMLVGLTEVRDKKNREKLLKEWPEQFRAMKNKQLNILRNKDYDSVKRKSLSLYLTLLETNPDITPYKAKQLIKDEILSLKESKDLSMPKKVEQNKVLKSGEKIEYDSTILYHWIKWFSKKLPEWKVFAEEDGVNLEDQGEFIEYVSANFPLHKKHSAEKKNKKMFKDK